jgi:hypothetical protein
MGCKHGKTTSPEDKLQALSLSSGFYATTGQTHITRGQLEAADAAKSPGQLESADPAKSPLLLGNQDVQLAKTAGDANTAQVEAKPEMDALAHGGQLVDGLDSKLASAGSPKLGKSFSSGVRVVATTEIRYTADLCVPKGTLGTIDSVLHTNLWINWDIPMPVENAVALASQIALASEESNTSHSKATPSYQQYTPALAALYPAQLSHVSDHSKEKQLGEKNSKHDAVHSNDGHCKDAAPSASRDARKAGDADGARVQAEVGSPSKAEDKSGRKEKNMCCCD